jgi:hypothetical protein
MIDPLYSPVRQCALYTTYDALHYIERFVRRQRYARIIPPMGEVSAS